MKNNSYLLFLSLFCLSCASSGSQNRKKLEHYKPKILDELEISNYLLKYQSAWNSHDRDNILKKYMNDAKVFSTNSKIEMNLNDFSVKLPGVIENMPTISFGMPSIKFLAIGICNRRGHSLVYKRLLYKSRY